MPTYTDRAAVAAYLTAGGVGNALPTDNTAADALIVRAEEDVDSVLGPWQLLPTRRKLDPSLLEADEQAALARCVACQVEHRLEVIGFVEDCGEQISMLAASQALCAADENHRQAFKSRVGADRLRKFQSSHQWHHEVCYDNGRSSFADHLQRDQAMGCRHNFMALFPKEGCQYVGEQEFVVGGFTPPQNSRQGFGAILVGYYERGRLLYAGKVGTGFSDRLLRSLHKRFLALRSSACPFANLPMAAMPRFGQGMTRAEMKKVTWLQPKLVAQIKFGEWTHGGILRQPVFLGLRKDKTAREVRREKTTAN